MYIIYIYIYIYSIYIYLHFSMCLLMAELFSQLVVEFSYGVFFTPVNRIAILGEAMSHGNPENCDPPRKVAHKLRLERLFAVVT